jgi:hypothetical protein
MELERFQRALARLEERYPSMLSLLDTEGLGVVFHLENRVIIANANASRLAGHSLPPACEVAEFVAPSERALLAQTLNEISHLDVAPSRHRYRIAPEGDVKQVELETVTLPGLFEGERMMLTLLTDVSARTPWSASTFEEMFPTAHDAMLVVDEAGLIGRANGAATALLGYDAAELQGLPVERLVPFAQRSQHVGYRERFTAAPRARAMRAGATLAALTKAGQEIPIDVALSPMTLGGAQVTVVTLRSLMAQRESVRALRESEARHRRIFEAATDGIFIADAAGIYVDVNPAGCAMLRCKREDIVGRPLHDFVMEEDLRRAPLRYSEVLAGAKLTVERLMRRPDGTAMPAEISAAALPGGFAQGFVRDLSERRRAEEALLEAAKLGAVGRLAGGIAHDFNNILTVILSLAEELRSHVATAEAREAIDELQKVSLSAAQLVRQLLAFARKQPAHPRSMDLNDELRAMSRFLQRTLGEGIELQLSLSHALPLVLMDPIQFQQCIVNLAANARDAMTPVGILRITTDAHEGGARVAVQDSGDGMAAETLEHIFEPFFTTKGHGRGTGLGLATVYGLVTHAGGRLSVQSSPGHGAVFTIWLPPTSVPVVRPSPPAPAVDGTKTIGSQATILMVDDNAAVQSAVALMLREGGYVVHAADGLETALDFARNAGTIDLLLTDVIMPRADGLAVANAVRALRPGVPVLFMSGFAPDAERLAVVGSLLAKPFTSATLLAAVKRALGRR